MAGLTTSGFVRKTQEEILAEIEASERSKIDPNLNTSAETPIGQLNGIVSDHLAAIWELAEGVNANQYPDTASGFGLDNVASITGTFRNPATKGTVTLTLTLNATTTVPAGSIAQVDGEPTNRWVTTADVTSTAAGDYDVAAEAENAGTIAANAGTITVIATPVAGWTAVTNAADAVPGDEIDTDTQLRLRRELELSRAGTATINAILADLLDVTDVESVSVFQNQTDYTDSDGLPPHSVECVVLGGTNADVAQGILDSVAAGIRTYGTTTENVTNDQGFLQQIQFTRPTSVDIYLEIDVDVDASEYPSNGDDLIETAVAAYGDANYGVGDDVILSALHPSIFTVAGVLDVTEIRVGTSPSPSQTTNYVIDSRELALLDTARIVVNS